AVSDADVVDHQSAVMADGVLDSQCQGRRSGSPGPGQLPAVELDGGTPSGMVHAWGRRSAPEHVLTTVAIHALRPQPARWAKNHLAGVMVRAERHIPERTGGPNVYSTISRERSAGWRRGAGSRMPAAWGYQEAQPLV